MALWKLSFQVSLKNSGEATYYAKCAGGYCPPYQYPVGKDRCKQNFWFDKIEDAIQLVSKMFDKFKEDFVIVYLGKDSDL